MGAERADFELVYSEEAAPLRRWLARHGGADCDADDLTAEVFARAYRGWDSYRGEASRRSWLWRIAANTLSSWRARRARDRSVSTADVPERPTAAADQPLAEDAAVLDLLRLVPDERARTAVYLRYVEGRPADEVAAELDLSPGAVRTLTYRALHAIREGLEVAS